MVLFNRVFLFFFLFLQPLCVEAKDLSLNQKKQYFREICFGSEFGSKTKVIHKWRGPVSYFVDGTIQLADRQALKAIVSDLNRLIGQDFLFEGAPGAQIQIHFAPQERFPSLLKNYKLGNAGYFQTHWDDKGWMQSAIILISSTDITQLQRNHIIREELTQSLGLMQDSYKYLDSIFQTRWTETQQFSPLDEQLIRWLYQNQVEAGMRYDDVEEYLTRAPQVSKTN